jgi:hypothetical protein
VCVGTVEPSRGRQLVSAPLSAALATKSVFSEEECVRMGVRAGAGVGAGGGHALGGVRGMGACDFVKSATGVYWWPVEVWAGGRWRCGPVEV